MEIHAGISFLISIGFLHFKQADAVYPGDKIILTMNDGCAYNADVHVIRHTPEWLEPSRINEAPPNSMEFYIRSIAIQYVGFFDRPPINVTHNPPNHTLRSVMIHMQIFFLNDYYIIDRTFEHYNPEHHGSWFPNSSKPARGYIYLTVPGEQKYRAPLIRQTFEEDEKRIRNLSPVMIDQKDPNTSPYHRQENAFSSGLGSTYTF